MAGPHPAKGVPDPAKSGELLLKYDLDMDFDSVPGLCARFGLTSD